MDEDFHEREIKRGKTRQHLSCFERRNENWKRGRETTDLAFSNYEFNRITFMTKKDTRHERLVKRNSFIRNTKIHSIQNN